MFDKVRQKKLIKKMNDLGFFDTESLICYDEKKKNQRKFSMNFSQIIKKD